jgi:molecular chaperone DnaK (HSP70)
MAGRLAVDFGTSNTVIAAWDAARAEGVPLALPELSRRGPGDPAGLAVIPSLIHYAADDRRWIGAQVLERRLYGAPATFRWMKSYVARRSPGGRRVGGRDVSHRQAGRDFLAEVLFAAAAACGAGEDVALTVPVESFEDYEDWLTDVAESAGIRRSRLIDEPAAAALGYGVPIRTGDVYATFDFGGGTLDVAVVLVEDAAPARRRCRVLGKAGADLGGISVDQWLFREVLRRTGRSDADDAVRAVSNDLVVACEAAKERLSFEDRAEVAIDDPDTGFALAATFTRGELEDLLDEHDFFAEIHRTCRRALGDARERGYAEEAIKAVFLVGGASQMPAVGRALRRIFGKDRVLLDRPLDAVARGAAAFVAGADLLDHIQHDYAIRHLDRERGEYDYVPVVKRGTPYPTSATVARLTVKASHDGQRELGLLVFEVSGDRRRATGGGVEIEYDPSGAARLCAVTPEDAERRSYCPIGSPAFLVADPPCQAGERRFEIAFGIDANKRLLMSARDLKSGRWTHRDYPMVKLR